MKHSWRFALAISMSIASVVILVVSWPIPPGSPFDPAAASRLRPWLDSGLLAAVFAIVFGAVSERNRFIAIASGCLALFLWFFLKIGFLA